MLIGSSLGNLHSNNFTTIHTIQPSGKKKIEELRRNNLYNVFPKAHVYICITHVGVAGPVRVPFLY